MLMASACRRFISRSSSSIKSAFRTNGPNSPFSRSVAAPSSTRSPLPSQSTSPLRRFTCSRCPSELGCAQSLLPLHSAAAAAARMTSCLSSTSRSCRALSQGTLCCTYPGPLAHKFNMLERNKVGIYSDRPIFILKWS